MIRFPRPDRREEDALTEAPRKVSRHLPLHAVQADLEEFLSRYSEIRGEDRRRQVVRNGYLSAREVQTGIGSVKVKAPLVRDGGVSGSAVGNGWKSDPVEAGDRKATRDMVYLPNSLPSQEMTLR